MNKRKGISLIVLVITILVMLILSGVVIVSLSKNSPVEKAKEATFKTDLKSFLDELSLFTVNKIAEDGKFNISSLIADKNICTYNTQKVGSENSIIDVLTSIKESKYKDKIEIIQGNLYYVNPTKKEQEWLLELGILFKGEEKGNILIEGDTLVGVSPGYINTGVLIIPNNVKKIASGAFLGCNGIFQVLIPDTVTYIPENCFLDCVNLTKVIMPDTIESIGSQAFLNCEKLQNVKMPKNLKTIDIAAFQNCRSITELICNENLININFRAFQECTSLSKVTFNNKLKNIEGLAFRQTRIKEAILPDSLVSLNDQVFLECVDLTKVHIGKNVISLGSGIIRSCNNITSVTISNENPKYMSMDNVIYQKPDVQAGEGIVLITVPNNKENIVFPKNLTRIGYLSFAGNNKIKNLEIPEGVTDISSNAFSECSIENLVLPASLRVINGRAIENVFTLKSITVRPGNPSISVEDDVIMQVASVQPLKKRIIAVNPSKKGEYVIPDYVSSIAAFGFTTCKNITKVTIPNSVTDIREYAFYSSCIEEVIVPGSVSEIGRSMFSNCKSLTKVTLEEGVSKISESMFDHCINLKTLNIPASLSLIEIAALEATNNLTNITVSNNSQHFSTDGKNIYDKSGTKLVCSSNVDKNIIVREGVTEIGDGAFYANRNLVSLTLPNTLNKIENKILVNANNVTKLEIPSSVNQIDSAAFVNANGLVEIVIKGGKTEQTLTGSPWGLPKGKYAIKWK